MQKHGAEPNEDKRVESPGTDEKMEDLISPSADAEQEPLEQDIQSMKSLHFEPPTAYAFMPPHKYPPMPMQYNQPICKEGNEDDR